MSKAPPEVIAQRQRKMNLSRDIRDMAERLERETKKLVKAAEALDLEVQEIDRKHGLGIYAVPTPLDKNDIAMDAGIAYVCKS